MTANEPSAKRRYPQPVRHLVKQVRELSLREKMFSSADAALVMVSGGQDSLTLLELLAGRMLGGVGPASVCALHVNHHLRGDESNADEALVRDHCARLGVELRVENREIRKADGNVQEEARLARREAAFLVAERCGCGVIALGHTADDQAETMLYRLGKYGGLAAMRGMLPCDPPWVRPLLSVRREDTASFCRGLGLRFAVDRGNEYAGYARTSIRQKVVPALEEALPGAVEAAARTAEVAAEIERLVSLILQEGVIDLDAAELDVHRLGALSGPARRLTIHEWLRRQGLSEASRAKVLLLESLLDSRGSAVVDLGPGLAAVKEYDRLALVKAGGDHKPPCKVPLSIPGWAQWNGLRLSADYVEVLFAPDPAREAYVDAASLRAPLTVRCARPGDTMRPLGAPGRRKLQDVLVDLRVPARARSHVPLVVAGEEIIWVGGWVVAEQGKITRNTKRIVRLALDDPSRLSGGVRIPAKECSEQNR